MVAPQQRGQVVVKSIGDINRETTVRARRVNPQQAPPRSNFGHANVVPTMIQGIGILNKYAKALQHPAHTLAAGMFTVNKSPISFSRLLQKEGKIFGTAKIVIGVHLGLTLIATTYATIKGFKK